MSRRGKRRWHFQFTPHDTHDWDANQIPVLVDGEFDGRARALVVTANRNGFFYVLDRTTGEYLLGAQYARQTWAKGLDDRGRPIVIPNMEPSEQGTLVYPSLQGSTNWSSPSYSPATGLLYVPVREMGSIYFKSPVEYRPGTYFTGGSEKALDEEAWGAVRAIEVATGKVVWDFRLPTPPWAGVMATAGGVVFGGSNEGNFYALDARTGNALWQFQTGGPIDRARWHSSPTEAAHRGGRRPRVLCFRPGLAAVGEGGRASRSPGPRLHTRHGRGRLVRSACRRASRRRPRTATGCPP